MVYQTALKGAIQYLLLMVHKGLDALILQLTNDTSTQIDHHLVLIGQLLVHNTLLDTFLRLFIKEIKEQPRHRFIRQDLQFMGILQVHNLIADIIGSLHQVHQRMTHITEGFTGLRRTKNTHFIG